MKKSVSKKEERKSMDKNMKKEKVRKDMSHVSEKHIKDHGKRKK